MDEMGKFGRFLTTSGFLLLVALPATILSLPEGDHWGYRVQDWAGRVEFYLVPIWTFAAFLEAVRRWKETKLLFRLLMVVYGALMCLFLVAMIDISIDPHSLDR